MFSTERSDKMKLRILNYILTIEKMDIKSNAYNDCEFNQDVYKRQEYGS